jgi:hypothetical protein
MLQVHLPQQQVEAHQLEQQHQAVLVLVEVVEA